MTREFSTILDDFEGPSRKSESGGLSIDIKRMLVLRAPLIVTVALVLAVPAMLAAWFLTPVVYTATGQIRYAMTTPSVEGEDRIASRDYASFVSTETRELTGAAMIREVLEVHTSNSDGTVILDGAFIEKAQVIRNFDGEDVHLKCLQGMPDVTNQIEYLMGTVKADRLGNSELVRVSCTLPTRNESRAFLAALLTKYRDRARERERNDGSTDPGSLMSYLDRIENGLEGELKGQQEAVNTLQEQLALAFVPPLPDHSSESESVTSTIYALEGEIQNLDNLMEEAQAKINRLEVFKEQRLENPGEPIVEYGINERLNQSQRVLNARSQENNAKLELAEIEETDKSTPRLNRAKERLAALQQNVRQVKSEVLSEIIDEFIANAKDERDRLESRKAATRERLDSYKSKKQQLENTRDARREEYQAAQSRHAKIQFQLEQAISRMNDTRAEIKRIRDRITEIDRKSQAPSRIEIGPTLLAPTTQDYKRKIIYVIMAFCGACAAGLGAGLALEMMDQHFRAPKDFARVTQLPVVGSIPDASEDPALDGVEHALLAGQCAGSRTADEFRRILSRILYPEENAAEVNTLLVVSPSRQDGKTSVASNLAIALGNSNRRVLLLDINTQRPQVERIFGLDRGPGLTEVLDGTYERDEAIRPAPYGNLYVMGPGLDALRLSSRLASREMVEFLEWADETFDHVIIDTPAILLVSDAKLLAPTVDAVMVVVGSGTTTFGMARRCLSDLEHLHANVIGLILNRARRLRGGYMRKNLELYYDYAIEDPDAAGEEIPEMEILETPDDMEEAVVLLPTGEADDREARGR